MTVPASINPLFFDAASGAYQISRSLRFRRSASGNITRTFGTPTTQNTFTFSCWTKRGLLSTIQIFFAYSNLNSLYFTAADNLALTNGSGTLTSTAVFRDPSAWYHICYTQSGTAVNIYVNGSLVITGTLSVSINTAASAHCIGSYTPSSASYDGYITEVYFVDGQIKAVSDFTVTDVTTGVLSPKAYTGTYGNNGFYLPFSNTTSTTTLVADSSGQGNNWTPNNISLASGTTYDSMIDSPTPYADGGNGRGNYATWNPLFGGNGSYLSQANLNFETASAYKATISTIGLPNSGLWYVEGTIKATGGSSSIVTFGVAKQNVDPNALGYNTANAWSVTSETTFYAVVNGTASQSWSSGRWVTGEVARLAIDMNNGRMWVGNSTVWFGSTSNSTNGDPANGTNPTITGLPSDLFVWASAYANGVNINFGQRPFSLTPPSGYSALNTQNLPTPTIANGAQHMGIATYTGNAGSNSYTSLSFQPDFLWSKSRTNTAYHYLIDSVRGTNKSLYSNATDAEGTITTTVTFNANGVAYNGSASGLNANTQNYVNWLWKAGGTGVTNTSGSITSTVSANTSAGFSVVTYTGTGANATVGHGLGVAPSMVIVKQRTAASATSWYVYHSSIGATYSVYLNSTLAQDGPNAVFWNNTAPTSNVFSIGTSTGVSANTGTFVAYCFAPVAGYSAFGSYTGNNSADGPFVYLGFRPRFLMIKDTTSAGAWWIGDSSRATNNVVAASLFPNTSGAESSIYDQCDFLSNGFKWRANSANSWPNNVSGNTYIYAAFAEYPFKIARAR